ncbi:MAG: hypothetical protein KDK70_04830 [Myxococcales bacterium]|nr:hypothetical protein [Myxococcales bacterium]
MEASHGEPTVHEIVYDFEGNVFELATQRHSSASSSFGGSSLRQVLGRAQSLRGVLDDTANRDALARALVEIGACTPGEAPSLPHEEIRMRARAAFSAGELTLVPHVQQLRPICDVHVAPAERLADEIVPHEPEVRPTHTLELELVDEDDEPVPHEPYRVELPSGRVIEGRLDVRGQALVTGIEDSGQCRVTFPRLDQAVWEPM